MIGVLFGGMIVLEISELIKVKKVILILSSRNLGEILKIYWLIGLSRLIDIVLSRLLIRFNWMIECFFGVDKWED